MIEHRNPIPPGVYWIDVFQPALPAWIQWRSQHAETIRVISSAHRSEAAETVDAWRVAASATVPALAALDFLRNYAGGSETIEWEWILFEVLAPTPRWELDMSSPLASPGLPTIATRDMSEGDVAQRPPPQEVDIGEFAAEPGELAGWMQAAWVGGGVLAAYLLLRALR